MYVVYVGAASNVFEIEYYELPSLNAEMIQYPESQSMTSILPPGIVHWD